MTSVPEPFFRPSYPGLTGPESRLLAGYLDETGLEETTRLHTNVPVGEGEVRRDLPPEFRDMAQELSRLRIDAVRFRGDRVEVVEMKSRIRTTGLGQLFLYDNIDSPELEIPATSQLVLVGKRIHPDVGEPLRQAGTVVHIVPEAQIPRFAGQS